VPWYKNNRALQILDNCAYKELLPRSFRGVSARRDDVALSPVHGGFLEFIHFPGPRISLIVASKRCTKTLRVLQLSKPVIRRPGGSPDRPCSSHAGLACPQTATTALHEGMASSLTAPRRSAKVKRISRCSTSLPVVAAAPQLSSRVDSRATRERKLLPAAWLICHLGLY
jgi:hypothetical protein